MIPEEDTSAPDEEEPNTWLPYVSQESVHVTTDSQILEQLAGMEYPIFTSLAQKATTVEKALSSTSAISRYDPPTKPLMGQINYPPAQANPVPVAETPNQGYSGRFRERELNHQPWTLPSAQQTMGAILVLPEDIGQYSDVIPR